MSGDLVVAPSDRSWHSGTGLLDSTASYCEALASESWVDAALSGVAVGFDVYATVVDPFGSLFAAGIGWIIDHLEPLKGCSTTSPATPRRSLRSPGRGRTSRRTSTTCAPTTSRSRTVGSTR